MKKIALVVGFGVASLALAGCTEQAAEDEGTADTEAVAEEAAVEEAPADEMVAEDEMAPDVDSMDAGDRGTDTGRTPDM